MVEENWEKVEIEPTPTWNFKEESELVGFLIGKQEGVGPNESMLYTIEKESGEKISVWGNTVLDGRFKNIEQGTKVKVVYKGKTKSPKTGREYHDFDIFKSNIVKEPDIPVLEE